MKEIFGPPPRILGGGNVQIEMVSSFGNAIEPGSNVDNPVDVEADEALYVGLVGRRRRLVEGVVEPQKDKILRKWRGLLLTNPEGSATGEALVECDGDAEQVQLLNEVFGGKSCSTLSKRCNCLLKYMQFCEDTSTGDDVVCFPVAPNTVHGYLQKLHREQKFSGIRELMQTLTFAKHVLGLFFSGDVEQPRISGILRDSHMHKNTLKQSRPLTVAEIFALERFVMDEKQHCVDRFGAGAMLFLLYSRGRVSDIRNIEHSILDRPVGDVRHGYLEMHTHDHKGRRTTMSLGIPLILLAPIYGLCDASWCMAYLAVAKNLGVDLEEGHRGPVLALPDVTGTLTDKAAGPLDVTKWMRGILRKRGIDVKPGLTSHGLKATLMSWASKAGMSEEDRRILGHHAMSGKKSMTVYSRDLQTAPTRRLEGVIASVRRGTFIPDASRSGMFSEEPPVSGAAAVGVQAIRGMSDTEETCDVGEEDAGGSGSSGSSSDSSASASSESESVLDNFIDERVQPETRDACKLGIVWERRLRCFHEQKDEGDAPSSGRERKADLPVR